MNKYGTKIPEIEAPLRSRDFSANVTKWEYKFLDMERDKLLELLRAADYMDMRGLLLLCSAKIAHEVRGMSTEEMREYLGVENDFTPEEEAEMKKELSWCNDVFHLEV